MINGCITHLQYLLVIREMGRGNGNEGQRHTKRVLPAQSALLLLHSSSHMCGRRRWFFKGNSVRGRGIGEGPRKVGGRKKPWTSISFFNLQNDLATNMINSTFGGCLAKRKDNAKSCFFLLLLFSPCPPPIPSG